MDNGFPMEVTLALLADAANISQQGKLNVLGAFTNISAQSFPARHPQMQLVLEISGSPSEIGGSKHLEVRLLDADGQQLGGIEADFAIPASVPRALSVRAGLVIPLIDVVFAKPGDHQFDVLINGESRKQILLSVTLAVEETRAMTTKRSVWRLTGHFATAVRQRESFVADTSATPPVVVEVKAGGWHSMIEGGESAEATLEGPERWQAEQRSWLKLSEPALARGWDNPRDAQYDDL